MTPAAGRGLALALLVVLSACGGTEGPYLDYHRTDSRLIAAASSQERLARIREHFEEGHRTKLSMRLLDQAVELLVEDLDDPHAAVELVESAIGRFETAELQRRVTVETRLPLLIRVGMVGKFHHIESEIERALPLSPWHRVYATAAGDGAALSALREAHVESTGSAAGFAERCRQVHVDYSPGAEGRIEEQVKRVLAEPLSAEGRASR